MRGVTQVRSVCDSVVSRQRPRQHAAYRPITPRRSLFARRRTYPTPPRIMRPPQSFRYGALGGERGREFGYSWRGHDLFGRNADALRPRSRPPRDAALAPRCCVAAKQHFFSRFNGPQQAQDHADRARHRDCRGRIAGRRTRRCVGTGRAEVRHRGRLRDKRRSARRRPRRGKDAMKRESAPLKA